MPIKDPQKRAENRRKNYLKNREREIAKMMQWRRDNPEKNARVRRNVHLRSTYGITTTVYEQMLAQQSGRCAICHREPEGEPLHVDHRHSDGVVRGLLCGRCNRAIGLLADDVESVKRALTYLGG